jgi:LemA protein
MRAFHGSFQERTTTVMKPSACIVIAVVALALLGVYLFFSQYIGLVSMNEVAQKDWADLDAQLRSRADLVPDLVSTVKERAPDEEEVFTGIADALGRLAVATTPPARAESEEALTAALGRLLATATSCPELNADEDFIRLQIELADAEKRIAASRKRYNDNVEIYNMCTGGFLVSHIAGRIGFLPREPFEPPKVSAEEHGEAVPDEAETEIIGD